MVVLDILFSKLCPLLCSSQVGTSSFICRRMWPTQILLFKSSTIFYTVAFFNCVETLQLLSIG